MKRLLINLAVFAAVALAIVGSAWFAKTPPKAPYTKEQAILIVQQEFPETVGYPSDSLPPRSIAAEQHEGIWYAAFVQEGSGLPILSARCYRVLPDGTAEFINEIQAGGQVRQNLSPVTCDWSDK